MIPSLRAASVFLWKGEQLGQISPAAREPPCPPLRLAPGWERARKLTRSLAFPPKAPSPWGSAQTGGNTPCPWG